MGIEKVLVKKGRYVITQISREVRTRLMKSSSNLDKIFVIASWLFAKTAKSLALLVLQP